jgi:hypothetical protein
MRKTADNPTGPAFVVFGIGADHKPRAARFDDSQPKLVAKAAELMHLKLCEINSPALADLAKRLPVGRLYANGNGFVPPVRKQLYATLAATVAAASRNAATNGAPRSPGLPRSWDEIAPGHFGHRQRRDWRGLVGSDCRASQWRHARPALARLSLAARYHSASVERRVDQARSIMGELLWLSPQSPTEPQPPPQPQTGA